MKRHQFLAALLGLALLAGLLLLAQGTLRGYYFRLVMLFGINIILAVSLNITNGYTGIFSLGHGGLMLVASYTAALLTLSPEQKARQRWLELPAWLHQAHLSFPLALLIGALAAMLAGVFILLPAFRLRGHYFILASLGINIVTINLAESLRPYTNGPTGLRGIPSHTTVWWVYGTAVLLIYLVWALMQSRFGRAFLAVGRDQRLAQALGIDVSRYKAYAFMLSAFFTGVGGVLWTHLILTLGPTSFDLDVVLAVVTMIVIGGLGSLSGAIVGAAIVTGFSELLAPLQEGITILGVRLPRMFGLVQVLFSTFLILVMIFRPSGLTAGRELSLSWLFRRHQPR